MTLTEEQRQHVATWIVQGAKLSEIQNRLAAEFGVKLTYMEARFLVDDLKLTPKDPEPPKVVAPPIAAATPLTTQPVSPAPAGGSVAVTVDQITKPGTAISGTVWEHPLTATSNSGSNIPQDARVDVYDRLIIIHLADGSRQVVPLDLVSNLKLK